MKYLSCTLVRSQRVILQSAFANNVLFHHAGFPEGVDQPPKVLKGFTR